MLAVTDRREGRGTDTEVADPWLALARQVSGSDFFAHWMRQLVRGTGNGQCVSEAVLIWQADDQAYRPAAFWPPAVPCGVELASLCEHVLAMRMPVARGAVVAGGARRSLIGMPVILQDELLGVIALAIDLPQLPPNTQDWLRWGMGWLAARKAGAQSAAADALRERLLVTLDLMLLAMAEPGSSAAAQALVTEAAVRLQCERVSVGFAPGQHNMRLAALSHSADFARKIELVGAIEAVMNEAVDQGQHVLWRASEAADAALIITRDHSALGQGFGSRVILSVPFVPAEGERGCFVFEWNQDELASVEEQFALGLPPVLGRVLHDKRMQDLPLPQRAARAVKRGAGKLFGPRHALAKLITATTLGLLLFFTFAHGEFRISASASVEGATRRQIVAPFDGFIAAAPARAGQVVKKGEVLARLDDRDINLEASRWSSQEAQYAQQARDAEAQKNQAQAQIAMAQSSAALAQRALSETMLERSRVSAPFAGVIISGDLSQQLGGAVKKGQQLFEIAPLDAYRLVMQVDEGDIAWLKPGEKGEVVVAALPGQNIPFTVTLVTSVAQPTDGRNTFRVEASLPGGVERLRPGMEGVAKVEIGRERLIWIWTRHFTDWLRLQAWSWLGV